MNTDIPKTEALEGVRELPELPEPFVPKWPTLNLHALGCGVEDRGLRDRYECAEYGWEHGVDRAAEAVPEEIFTADQMREYALADRAANPDAADLAAVYDAFDIGSAARTIDTLLMCIKNAVRRSACLTAVEDTFFVMPTPPEDDGVPGEECLLNWGHDPAEYVQAFREALKTRAATPAAPRSAAPRGIPIETARTFVTLSAEQIARILMSSDLRDMHHHMGWYSAPERAFKEHGTTLAREIERALAEANASPPVTPSEGGKQ